MSKPLIAVSTDVKSFENYEWHAAPEQYLRAAIRAAGVTPLLVPSFESEIDLEARSGWRGRADAHRIEVQCLAGALWQGAH